MNMPQRYAAPLLILAALALLGGCATVKEVRQLSSFKEKYNAGDYAALAAEQIAPCTKDENGCNQLHLLQGNACYALAKNDAAERTGHLQCAADNLEKGIAMTGQWRMEDLDLKPAQNYENLCESLRLLTDRLTGSAALQVNDRLLAAAGGFAQVAPGTPGPVYYETKAEYRQLQPRLIRRDATACEPLKALSDEAAGGATLAGTGRYAPLFKEFEKVLSLSVRSLPGCR